MNPSYQAISGNYARSIIIGDIHGCHDELQRLLVMIGYTDADLLLAVGDMVDRGPDSWKVAEFFRSTPNAYSVLGNHERRLAGVIRGTSQPAWSQLHSLGQIADDQHQGWADYFKSLPAIIETPHAIVTHARLDPGKPLNTQEAYHTCAVGGARIQIELDEEGIPLWFRQWKSLYSNNKPICIGHICYRGVELEKSGLYALDTGAVKGQQLTAVIFPQGEVVSVDCPNHYAVSRAEWLAQETGKCIVAMPHTPLSEIDKLLRDESQSGREPLLTTEFNRLLEVYDLEQRAARLRGNLFARFGAVPKGEAEKGDYFRQIRSHFASSLSQRLLGLLLGDAPFQIDKLLKVFQRSSLDEIAATYHEIEKFESMGSHTSVDLR